MEAHMAECRLRVKIGPYEMEAEGPRDFVEKHYGSFSERIPANTQSQLVPVSNREASPAPASVSGESLFAGIFHTDNDGMLSLTARPSGENAELDAALLVLFGYKELMMADLVSADQLVHGLRQSGFAVERADRIMGVGVNQGLLTKSGVRRGTRYRLTNQGALRARSVGQALLETLA
jgi:hypothetical protein